MEDLKLAKEELEKEDRTFVLVREGALAFSSQERGIRPILGIFEGHRDLLGGATVADRVIGRAAALFLREGKIQALYAQLISQEALALLEKAGISVHYGTLVDHVLNRDQTGLCPMERLSTGVEEPAVLAEKIRKFFAGK